MASRVSLFDAKLLDSLFVSHMAERLKATLSLFPEFASALEGKEYLLQAACGAALLIPLLSNTHTTPGAAVHGIAYEKQPSRVARFALVAFGTVGDAALALLSRRAIFTASPEDQGRTTRDHGSINHVIKTYGLPLALFVFRVATLANFVSFLRTGQYATLLERLLGIRYRPVNAVSTSVTAVSALMATNMLLATVTEFARFLREYADWQQLSQRITRNLRRLLSRLRRMLRLLIASIRPKTATPTPQFTANRCAFCGISCPLTPLRLECGHQYCYVCFHSLRDTNSLEECSACGEPIELIT